MYSMQRSCSSQQFTSSNNNTSSSSKLMSNNSQHSFGGGLHQHHPGQLERSLSTANCEVINKRGFKPSDRFDPAKKEFLLGLSKQIWQRDAANPGRPKQVNLQKIFTPADDAPVILPQKNRKLYASSAFFAPGFHPTVEDQVQLARMISSSLYDSSNVQSKGQSMYVNRKKRSVKWVHEGVEAGHALYDEDSIDLGSSIDNICEEASIKAANANSQQFQMKQLTNDSRGKSPDIQSVRMMDQKPQSNVGMTNEDAQISQTSQDEESNAKRRKHNESNRSVVEVQIAAFEKQQAKHRVVKQQLIQPPEVEVVQSNIVSSMSNASNESSVSTPKEELECRSEQEVTSNVLVQAALTDLVPAVVASVAKRPKGWKPVCPNLPRLTMPVLTYADLAPIAPTCPPETQPEINLTKEDIEVVAALSSTFIAEEHKQHLQQTFVNCIAKSPELLKSDASAHFIEYDSTVNELKQNIVRSDPKTPPSPMTVAATSAAAIEPQFDTKTRVTPKPVVQALYSMRPTTAPIVAQSQVTEEEEPESYKTIPVRDLISTFEKQSQPQIRSNIREDKFPTQIDSRFTGPPPVVEVHNPPPPTLPDVPRRQSSPPVAQTPPSETLSFSTVFDQNNESTNTPTIDALVEEINTFNEVAADFSASISSSATTKCEEETSGVNSSSTQEVTYTQPSPTFGGHRNSMPSPIQPSFHLASPPQAPAGFFSPSPIPPAEPQHYPLPQPTMWQPSYVPPSEVTVTPSFIQRSPPPSRSASAMAAAARRSPLDLNAMENYNRAARGWGQSKDFYRPITFNKPKVVLGYTDF